MDNQTDEIIDDGFVLNRVSKRVDKNISHCFLTQ